MAYSLYSDVQAIAPLITSSSVTVTNLITAQIAAADALINAKLATRYSLPFASTATSTPPLIKEISKRLALAYSYNSHFARDGAGLFEYTGKIEQEWMNILGMIAKRQMDVVSSAGSALTELSAETSIDSTTMDYTPTFGEDDTLSQCIDSDKLSDISDDRS